MKKKRPDLIGIEIRELPRSNGYNGSFEVIVYNNTTESLRHSIGIEASSPISVFFESKHINELKRPSILSETHPVTVKPDSIGYFLFHWNDVDRSPKIINVRAKFKHVKSQMMSF